jgi:hypothetical protein
MAKPKCNVCGKQLRKLSDNKWMCGQSPSVCKESLKITYIKLEEE